MGRMGKDKGNGKNSEVELLERRKRVADLYVRGHPQHRIAEMIGVCTATIRKDIQKIRDEWLALAIVDFNEKKAQEVAKIDHLEEVAWAAWERSCNPSVSKRKGHEESSKVVRLPVPEGSPPGTKPEVSTEMRPSKIIDEEKVQYRDGNPAFLERIAWCVEMRLKIFGLLKDPGTTVNVVNLNWEQLLGRPEEPDPIEAEILSIRNAPPAHPSQGGNGNGRA